jgi:hypothetical protein
LVEVIRHRIFKEKKMNPKQQGQKDTETLSKQKVSEDASTFASTNRQSDLARAVQRARFAPKLLSSSDILRLQRTLGNRSVMRLLSQKQPTILPSAQAVIQRVLDGTAFTLEGLADKAKAYDLHSWSKGQFLTYEKSDFTTNSVHIHFYESGLKTEEDEVVLSGHAIWNKNGGRCEQLIKITATRNKRWRAVLEKGDENIEVNNANPESKARLYTEVVDILADLVEQTLNDD